MLDRRAGAALRPLLRAQRRRGRRARRPNRTSPTSSTRSSRRRPPAPGRAADADARRALLRGPRASGHEHRQPFDDATDRSRVLDHRAHRPAAAARGRDFWLPLAVIASSCSSSCPGACCCPGDLTVQDVEARRAARRRRRPAARSRCGRSVTGTRPEVQASYTLAVYFFAPLVIARAAHRLVGRRREHDHRRARARQRRVPRPLPRHRRGDLPRQAHRRRSCPAT